MTGEIIDLEDINEAARVDLKKLLLLIPPEQREDLELKRLLLFRLQLDGLHSTRAYLVEKTREADRCGYTGSMYDYLKDDHQARVCRAETLDPSPLR
jgi:hypothetical protein